MGVASKHRKLVEHYVQLDPNMRPQDIVAKIEKDHGVEVTNLYVSSVRLSYLRSVGLLSHKKCRSGIPVKVNVPAKFEEAKAGDSVAKPVAQANRVVVGNYSPTSASGNASEGLSTNGQEGATASVLEPLAKPTATIDKGSVADKLEDFLIAVNAVGGKEAALRILKML